MYKGAPSQKSASDLRREAMAKDKAKVKFREAKSPSTERISSLKSPSPSVKSPTPMEKVKSGEVSE